MRVILFGATGMVGQGVLRECLRSPDVSDVLAVGRTVSGQQHAKLREIVHRDFLDFTTLADRLTGYDACFFCLGTTSVGVTEADYRRITVQVPMAAARALVARNPSMVFIHVSGSGANSNGKSPVMWTRVKGEAENQLRALPFRAVYVFRPGYIQPLHGIRGRTRWLRVLYAITAPFYPILRAVAPRYVTTTEQIGRAMLVVARRGAPVPVLENADINAAAV